MGAKRKQNQPVPEKTVSLLSFDAELATNFIESLTVTDVNINTASAIKTLLDRELARFEEKLSLANKLADEMDNPESSRACKEAASLAHISVARAYTRGCAKLAQATTGHDPTKSSPTSNVQTRQLYDLARDLPIWNGDQGLLQSFKAMFDMAVHRQPISSEEKFLFLRRHLSGPPLHDVELLEITAENYDWAYRELLERRSTPQRLAEPIVSRILRCAPMKSASMEEVRRYASAFTRDYSALCQLGLPDPLDFMMFSMAYRGMTSEFREEFSGNVKESTAPSFADLAAFLDRKVYVLSTARGPEGRLPPQTTVPRGQAPRSATSPGTSLRPQPTASRRYSPVSRGCSFCSSSQHRIYRCGQFLREEISRRRAFVDRAGLCCNCLSERHSTSDCHSDRRCFTCGEAHHTCLHRSEKSYTGDRRSPPPREKARLPSPPRGSSSSRCRSYYSSGSDSDQERQGVVRPKKHVVPDRFSATDTNRQNIRRTEVNCDSPPVCGRTDREL